MAKHLELVKLNSGASIPSGGCWTTSALLGYLPTPPVIPRRNQLREFTGKISEGATFKLDFAGYLGIHNGKKCVGWLLVGRPF